MKRLIYVLLNIGVLLTWAFDAQAMDVMDRRIYQQITREIEKSFAGSDVDIRVHVENRTVTVEGLVSNGSQRYVVDMIVRRNNDVTSFQNRIRIDGVKEKTDYLWDK